MKEVLMEMVMDRVEEKVNATVNETTLLYISGVMDSFGVSAEKAMDSLKIPQSQRETYTRLLNERKQ